MMVIDNKYDIGEILYLVTDEEQKKRVCTSIKVCGDGVPIYELSCGVNVSEHYDFELSRECDVAMKTA